MRRVLIATALLVLAVPAGADPGEHVSSLADQRAVAVTIYNENIALVRDERRLTLPRGRSRIALRDVSAQIQSETALFRSLTAPNAIDIVEQNFDYDLLSPQKLLEKYVGRDVTVIHKNPQTGAQTRETARVLATNDGIVLKYADRIETTVDGTLAFPMIPGNLRDRPTLTIDIDNKEAQAQNVELTYLTGGLSWRADYVGELSADGKQLELDGSITLTNGSGTTYENAALSLVAGDVNVAQRPQPVPAPTAITLRSMAADTATRVSDLGDFHLYTLPRKTTIADRQTKQVALLSAHAIPVTRTLELRGQPYYYQNAASDLGQRLPILSYLSFTNENGDLGVPLPAGIVRVYQHDVDGNNQFIGSDSIPHTPKRENVRLYLGNSFDVTARKKQTDYHVVSERPAVRSSSYEIVVSNAKTTPATVLVVEPIPGDWTIVNESAPHTKTSSGTASWTLTVPASGSATLTYTANVRF